MSEQSKEIEIDSVSFMVYFDFEPGQREITDREPDFCQEGISPSADITGVYIYDENGENQWDLVDMLHAEVIEQMVDDILENL